MTITRIDVDATDTTAARFDALAHPVRLRLLHLIAEHSGSLCVEDRLLWQHTQAAAEARRV